jgi:hypothetical protein
VTAFFAFTIKKPEVVASKKFGLASLIAILVIFGWMLTDPVFFSVISLPDNIPIIILNAVVLWSWWFAMHKGVENDKRIARGDPPIEGPPENREKVWAWPNLVYTELFCGIACTVFLIVWAINYYHSRVVLDSLLKALTIAMSVIPEEIPVAFASFMALGAWRLMKIGIIAKQTKTVETLGSATVICTDKTGTITENKMSLAQLYLFQSNTIVNTNEKLNQEAEAVLGDAHITVNKNTIPNDPEKPFVTSGIRLGTPAMTTRGFKETEAQLTGNLIADVFDNPRDPANIASVRARVNALTASFPVYR